VSSLAGWLDPKVDQYLLASEREYVVLEIHKHWMASIWAWARLAVAFVLFVSSWSAPQGVFWLLTGAAVLIGVQAGWKILDEYRDRFVVTDQRVFRVHGTFSVQRASVPLGRILDITVKRPLIGRMLNYGHFVFESAAQVQGLGEISHVRDIDQCDLVLQETIQRVGRRGQPPETDDGT
jgi:membrane protein YdbS with pleckstrin-like domain